MVITMNGDQDNPIITVEKLMVGYGGNTVLEEVSFSVSRGEVFTVLGPSGCGKTTLLKAMTGLLPVVNGKVSIAGEEIGLGHGKDALRRLRSRIGVLFQSGALFGSLTLWDNVMLPLVEFTDLPPELMDTVVQ
jgi:phospholipid/cholesterol/gamma-HCH transport system ATP-binding protein